MSHLVSSLRLPGDPSHPTQVALRTYSLSLSLSLGPSLLPFVLAWFRSTGANKYNGRSLLKVLRRELGYDGFAFAMTLAVGGGEVLRRYWSSVVHQEPADSVNSSGSTASATRRILQAVMSRLTSTQRTMLANVLSATLAIVLIQLGRYRSFRLRNNPNSIDAIPFTLSTPSASHSSRTSSPTVDLTLLFVVRAFDAAIQALIFKRSQSNTQFVTRLPIAKQGVQERLLLERPEEDRDHRHRHKLTTRVDALVFWACSARLPRSYVKWIGSLANIDERLINALRSLRSGSWSYIYGSTHDSHLLPSLAQDLDYPPAWGDPLVLPAYGGRAADAVWSSIGVNSRPAVGGIPCELVHGGIMSRLGLDASCVANSTIRGLYAFAEAVAIYLPVHTLPVLITRPRSLFRPRRAVSTVLGALRSAVFLSAFVSSYWLAVCFTRTLGLARFLPLVSHDFWDGPYGGIMAGCLVCGSSIWIENGRRRGEMALYVLPRAIRACLPNSWINGRYSSRAFERLAFVMSFTYLMTAAIHQPDSLRGLSRWAVAFVLKGPNAGFWKRKRDGQSSPATPCPPTTPTVGLADAAINSTSQPQN